MKKILIPILGMTLLTFFNSCSDEFLDVNENVNQQYADQTSPKDRLAAAEHEVYRTYSTTMNRFGNLMMNAWGGNVYFYASPYGDEFKMRADTQFYDEIWDNLYLGVANYQSIIDNPRAASFPHHVAIAKIMKAYYMQMIVDLYNDVPYSQAFKGQVLKNPKYDKGKDVYKGLLAELDQAKVLIAQTPQNSTFALAAAEDPIFKATSADMSNWTKMANTVRLKMLVRLSKITDPEVISWRNAELQAMSSLTSNAANFITADVRIDPGYNTGAASQRNPFYQAYGRVDIDVNDLNPTWRQTFASDHIIKTLTGQTPLTAGVIDGRIQRLFIGQALSAPSQAIGSYKGQVQGALQEAGAEEGDFAMLGLFMLYNSSSATTPGYVLTLSEVRFLQAEAALVYPTTMLFNAQTSFNDGITQSFTTFGSAAGPAYLAAIAAKPGMGWAATTNKIEAIQYQKWIALTHINPTETFISYNKTGFPQLPMPLGAFYPRRPNRLMYAQSEYISNTANVPNPSIDDMYSVNQYSPFWMK
ncbi:SusD/RagB family nutrient-binding outer membrane lipoprotein [Chryseobacterium caseinilyticum]|uniref:SusD/RagB family nutrient-binding outer membrane lipoprotein n=1 Tax=Chryseobacterium caseinilyticum TaxID=2771428 RepID=A0ABR8ZF45_9FLAO|nr:SusD/RagB family nutrient-binding outer membrane lipoprotein [Chryseobacterium caseinilyticum]MBD8083931.1 SusD/RagB family nutrient-binding outer membrane lipoprotein [Chryseobacterium caseinilyticum]